MSLGKLCDIIGLMRGLEGGRGKVFFIFIDGFLKMRFFLFWIWILFVRL